MQMGESKFSGKAVVEHNIGDAVDGPMTGKRDYRNSEIVLQRGINGKESFRAAPQKHLAILFDQILAVPVVRGEIEVARFHQVVSDAAHDLSVVAIAQFGNQNSDGVGSPTAERTSQEARLVVQLFGGGLDAVPRCLWNGAPGDVVQNDGNRSRVETQMFSKLFQPT